MTTIGCGPHWRVDGPPPLPPPFGLLQAADGENRLVRINPAGGLDAEQLDRYLNGIEVWPFPVGPARTYDTYSVTSPRPVKDDGAGDEQLRPRFAPFTVYVPETCSTFGVPSEDDFVTRARLAMAAMEGTAVEREFLTGELLPDNPHLADGEGVFPAGDDVTNVVNALAILENEIAATGKAGIIHVSPAFATHAAAFGVTIGTRTGAQRTVNGTLVIPGTGYAVGATPLGHADPDPTAEWVYATGPVDVRRTEPIVLPGDVASAMNREENLLTYIVERHYLVSWDTTFKAAVLADRCQSNC